MNQGSGLCFASSREEEEEEEEKEEEEDEVHHGVIRSSLSRSA